MVIDWCYHYGEWLELSQWKYPAHLPTPLAHEVKHLIGTPLAPFGQLIAMLLVSMIGMYTHVSTLNEFSYIATVTIYRYKHRFGNGGSD